MSLQETLDALDDIANQHAIDRTKLRLYQIAISLFIESNQVSKFKIASELDVFIMQNVKTQTAEYQAHIQDALIEVKSEILKA